MKQHTILLNVKTNKLIFIFLWFSVMLFTACGSHKNAVRPSEKTPHAVSSKPEINQIEKDVEKHLKGKEKAVVEEAFEWIGTKYEFGRQDKGVATDCSGLVMRVYEKAIGCQLPRNSAKQAEYCKEIKEKSIKPGDLVFFITNNGTKINHVGIMIDSEQFIHASSKGVVVATLQMPYYRKVLQQFGRVPCMD